ncbi:hypothetical protein K7432_004482 [Basidiobolus ranarum]|uniref:Helicase C-terminal domain-containing protein n=1 Tax=Basidiobolus ranarum TaxID=34480 RepID=A0ABR2WY63_9FUNG
MCTTNVSNFFIKTCLLLAFLSQIQGSTTVKVRVARIKEFAEAVPDNGIKVMLINLRCGAYGLNLQMASVVIFADNWWNPYVEMQAKAWVWRVNQTNIVDSYQLVMQNSIESENVIRSQSRKLNLFGRISNRLTNDSSENDIENELQEQLESYMRQLQSVSHPAVGSSSGSNEE